MTEVITKKVVVNEEDVNRDPLSGTPGAHPLGTGAGAASGGVAGAAAGMAVGGPVGGMVGAVVGAVAGGLAGKSAAEAVNPRPRNILEGNLHPGTLPSAGSEHEYYRRPFAPDGKAACVTTAAASGGRIRFAVELQPRQDEPTRRGGG